MRFMFIALLLLSSASQAITFDCYGRVNAYDGPVKTANHLIDQWPLPPLGVGPINGQQWAWFHTRQATQTRVIAQIYDECATTVEAFALDIRENFRLKWKQYPKLSTKGISMVIPR